MAERTIEDALTPGFFEGPSVSALQRGDGRALPPAARARVPRSARGPRWPFGPCTCKEAAIRRSKRRGDPRQSPDADVAASHVCVAGLDRRRTTHPAGAGRSAGSTKEIAAEFGGPVPARRGRRSRRGQAATRSSRSRGSCLRSGAWPDEWAWPTRTSSGDRWGASYRSTPCRDLRRDDGRDGWTASMPAGTGRASLGVYRPRSRVTLDRSYGKLRIVVSDPDLGALSLPLTD